MKNKLILMLLAGVMLCSGCGDRYSEKNIEKTVKKEVGQNVVYVDKQDTETYVMYSFKSADDSFEFMFNVNKKKPETEIEKQNYEEYFTNFNQQYIISKREGIKAVLDKYGVKYTLSENDSCISVDGSDRAGLENIAKSLVEIFKITHLPNNIGSAYSNPTVSVNNGTYQYYIAFAVLKDDKEPEYDTVLQELNNSYKESGLTSFILNNKVVSYTKPILNLGEFGYNLKVYFSDEEKKEAVCFSDILDAINAASTLKEDVLSYTIYGCKYEIKKSEKSVVVYKETQKAGEYELNKDGTFDIPVMELPIVFGISAYFIDGSLNIML